MKLGKKEFALVGGGALVGFVSGMLGAGGGMLAVPLLKKSGLAQKAAHTNAVAVILPVAAFSAVSYLYKGYVTLGDAWRYIPSGLLGAIIGTLVLKKISPNLLKRIFGGFMIYAGVRLLIR